MCGVVVHAHDVGSIPEFNLVLGDEQGAERSCIGWLVFKDNGKQVHFGHLVGEQTAGVGLFDAAGQRRFGADRKAT